MMPFRRSIRGSRFAEADDALRLSSACREHAGRARNRSQGIPDFMRDRGGQPSHSCQPVLHADFALQAANFGQIIECVYVPKSAALGNRQR